MSRFGKWLATAVCVAALVQVSQAGLSVGGKLWMVSFDDSAGADSAFMFGPKADLSGDTFWLSGMFLFGKADASDGSGETLDMQDGEALVGMSLSLLDIGVGVRDTTWKFSYAGSSYGDLTIWGPMAYIGAGGFFGESPVGWYIGASYMFFDLGDLRDQQDALDEMDVSQDVTGEHYNVEAGLSLALDRFSATLGYRQKTFVNWDGSNGMPDLSQKGIAASASFSF